MMMLLDEKSGDQSYNNSASECGYQISQQSTQLLQRYFNKELQSHPYGVATEKVRESLKFIWGS